MVVLVTKQQIRVTVSDKTVRKRKDYTMSNTAIPFSALTGSSKLVINGVRTSTPKYGTDGKIVAGEHGDPKLDIV